MVNKYPVLTYFFLTLLLSLVGLLFVVEQTGFPGPERLVELHFPFVLTSMLLSPLLAAVLLIAFLYGKKGFRDLTVRFLSWKLSFRWYFIALLVLPILVAIILGIMSLYSIAYLPAIITQEDTMAILLGGLGVGIFGGLLEEIGWTGFAVPALKQKGFNWMATGLMVGFVWGLWHLPITYWASGDENGVLSEDLFLPPLVFYLFVLPVFRMIMVWLYWQTDSLLLAVLMHASLIFSTLFVLPPAATGNHLVLYYLILTAALCALVFLLQKRSIFSKKKKMRSIITLLLVAAISLPTTAQTYTGKQKDIDQILEKIEQFSTYVVASDHEKIGAAYTEDAKIFPGDRDIIAGRSDITGYWKMPEDIQITYHKVTPVEIKIKGKEAYDYGYYEGTTKGKDGNESSWKGKYVIIWKKVDKEWKMYLDIWNRIRE
jgi:ketosteroid isomerase-like protein/membrane protease YdiL (CAAX protease family)